MQTDATLLANNSEHCCMLHVASVCTLCYMLLGVVAQSLKPVKLLRQQLPTFLLFLDRRSVAQQCRIRLYSSSFGPRTRITYGLQSWKEGQHLTRAWLTLKRTISRIPNKEAQNPTSRSKILANPASGVAVKSVFPIRNLAFSRILHSILVKSRIPKIPSRPCLDSGDWYQWVLTNGRCSDAFALPFTVSQGSCLEPCYLRHILSRATSKIFSRLQTKPEHSA